MSCGGLPAPSDYCCLPGSDQDWPNCHYNGVNGEGRATTYMNCSSLSITREPRFAALRIGRPGAPGAATAHSPDLAGCETRVAVLYLWIPRQGQSGRGKAGVASGCIWATQTHSQIAPRHPVPLPCSRLSSLGASQVVRSPTNLRRLGRLSMQCILRSDRESSRAAATH